MCHNGVVTYAKVGFVTLPHHLPNVCKDGSTKKGKGIFTVAISSSWGRECVVIGKNDITNYMLCGEMQSTHDRIWKISSSS